MLTQKRDVARLSRRTLFAGTASLPFSFSLARVLRAANSDDSLGLVMREREPQNLESDFSGLAAITPNSQFYVRNHFPAPELDAKSWTLRIEGAVTRIVAVTQPFRGYFQTVDYAYWQQHDGFMQRVPVTEMQVKSQIARPVMAEVVAKGKPYRVFGAAWAGASAVSKVEVSTDGGRGYAAAKLLAAPAKHAWRLWEFAWEVPDKAGKYGLLARATDANGNSQPLERDKDREAYMINHLVPVEVRVQ